MMRLSEQEEAQRMAAWKQGLSDKEIAAKLGLNAETVRGWRFKWGLPRNAEKDKLRQEEQRMRFYRAGWSDSEIGKAVGMNPQRVYGWRKTRNLPINTKPKVIDPKTPRDYHRLYLRGMTVPALATMAGCTAEDMADCLRLQGVAIGGET